MIFHGRGLHELAPQPDNLILIVIGRQNPNQALQALPDTDQNGFRPPEPCRPTISSEPSANELPGSETDSRSNGRMPESRQPLHSVS